MSDNTISSIVIQAKLLAYNEDTGGYTTYVFQNLESDNWANKYIMCVRYPNWESSYPDINDIGFLQCTYIIGGASYYNRMLDMEDKYKYSHIRFDKFLPIEKKVDSTITL